MKVLSKLNNLLKNILGQDAGGTDQGTVNKDEFYHSEYDPRKNSETSPPQDEKIRIPALWAFEVYTPSYIANFNKGVSRLGWTQDNWSISSDFQDTLYNLRSRASGSGWINLGYIVDETTTGCWSGTKKAKLPDGIEAIKASILQFLPSTTILACQFIFADDLASSIENPLREIYSTYKEKTKNGYMIIDVLHQKKDAVILAREYLRNLCTGWFTENFPGIFSAGYLEGDFPVCELVTFTNCTPYQKMNDKNHDNFLSILDLSHDFDAWQSNELKGLFLQLSEEGGNQKLHNLVLSGNINDLLSNKDLNGYGETSKDSILNYLNYLDKTLGVWVLFVIIKTFERRLTKLRDAYGESDMDNPSTNFSILMNLDRQILDIQKNTTPFICEIKNFCEHERVFMHDVFEFKAVHEMRKKDAGLFSSIRKRLLFYAELLDRNEKLLRNTADANRQIVAVKASNHLAQTNLGLQKRMNWMTFVILLLTIVTTFSAIIEIQTRYNLASIFKKVINIIKLFT